MSEQNETGAPEVVVWHDEADRLAAWGTLDPPDACMCRDCVIPPVACGATDAHGVMRDREHLSVCPICNVDLTRVLPPGE